MSSLLPRPSLSPLVLVIVIVDIVVVIDIIVFFVVVVRAPRQLYPNWPVVITFYITHIFILISNHHRSLPNQGLHRSFSTYFHSLPINTIERFGHCFAAKVSRLIVIHYFQDRPGFRYCRTPSYCKIERRVPHTLTGQRL